MTEPIATQPRLLLALLYAAGRFVPIPFVDDLVREQVALYAVAKAVEARGATVPRAHLVPLGSPAIGCLGGCLGLAVRIPLMLILFPIRKITNVIFGVRNVTRDVVEIVLLCRLVDRAVARGEIAGARGLDDQRREALLLRQALDAALESTDLTILSTTLRAVLGPFRGVMLHALGALRVRRRTGPDAAPPASDATLSESTSRLERAFDRPEVRALIEKLDADVDTHLSRLRAAAAARSI
jgi:hypothetical protein